MLPTRPILARLALAAALGFSCVVHADWRPTGVMVQGGAAPHGTVAASVGAVWQSDWRWKRSALFSYQTEFFLSQWRADRFGGGGHYGLQQAVLLPVLRAQPDAGRSPWFFELGIGASYLSKDYHTPDKEFGSRWNFYDMLGVGYQFGAGRTQELGLRYTHISNLSIRKPNPGEDFLMLRYARRF